MSGTAYAPLHGALQFFSHARHPQHVVLDNSGKHSISYRCMTCSWFSWKPR